jgi:hypothetical protein
MPRKRPAPPEPPALPPVIHRDAVYTLSQATHVLGMAEGTLAREIHLGRIRSARRGGRTLFLGAWLIAWVESGTESPDCGCDGRLSLGAAAEVRT